MTIGSDGLPKLPTTSVTNAKLAADIQPLCAPQTGHVSLALCGPALLPIVARVEPQPEQAFGNVTITPRMPLDSVELLEVAPAGGKSNRDNCAVTTGRLRAWRPPWPF
jgi:hypothetical protein